jgi:drug/metabolite transporter (DMT)-like permease
MALGTQIAGGLMLAPFLAFAPPAAMPSALVVASVLAMGVVCGAVAYVLYFRLVTDIGAAGALTVTYLIPLFGVAFGAVFLDETISLVMLGGGALVLLGTFLVLRK